MKTIIFLLIFTLFGIGNVNADSISNICNNEYLKPFIRIVSTVINLIKIGVPIILIILGMLDMVKAVLTQKEEKIKEGQKNLMSRLITGAVVFFIVAIVQLLAGIIKKATGDSGFMDCACKFIGCSSNSSS